MNKQDRNRRFARLAAFTLLGLGGLTAAGIGWPLPLQESGELVAFTAGDVARAEDVNANFRKLDDAVVAARGDVSSLRGDVDDNSGEISSVKSDVSRNTSDIDAIEARLDVIEKSFVRAAYSQDTAIIDDFSESAFTPIHSLVVKAPADGILVIMATVSHEWDANSGANSATQAVHRVTVDGVPVSVDVREELRDPSVGSFDASAVTVTCAAAVTAGDRTVNLELSRSSGANVFVYGRSITSFFLPFGNNGIQGVLDKALLDLDVDDRFGMGADEPNQD